MTLRAYGPGCVAALLAGSLAGSAAATVLTFDVAGLMAGISLDQAYGDRVTSTSDAAGSYLIGAEGATPNVGVDYLGSDPKVFTTHYNELVNVFYNETDGSDLVGFVLTADPGFDVTLSSLDIGNWGVSVTLPFVRVLDGGGTELFRQDDVALADWSGSSLALSFSGVTAALLRVEIGLTGLAGNSDNVGLDNIRFAQNPPGVAPVPLPGGLALLIGGLAMLGAIIRRRALPGC